MSLFEKFRSPQRDERLVAEENKIYKTGFLILSFGILLDLYYGISCSQVALFKDGSVNPFLYFSPVELIVLLGANLYCLFATTRKGITSTGKFADVDSFPARYYLAISGAAGLGAGIAVCFLRALAEWQILGAGGVFWLTNIIMGVSVAVAVFLGCLLLFWITFVIAKKQQRKQLELLDAE